MKQKKEILNNQHVGFYMIIESNSFRTILIVIKDEAMKKLILKLGGNFKAGKQSDNTVSFIITRIIQKYLSMKKSKNKS